VALVVLLPAELPQARVGGHEDAGLSAVNAGRPGALGAGDATVRVQFGGVLAEVPDVAARVLAVPVDRALAEAASQVEPVVDDDAGDAGDRLRLVCHGHDVA